MKPKWKWLTFVTISSMIVPLATVACQPENKTDDGSGQKGSGDENGDGDNNKNGDDNKGGDNQGGGDNPGGGGEVTPGDKNNLIGEIQKLTYTGLNDGELKALTIADDTLLTEEVAEKLGFVLPDAIKNLIETQPNQANPQFQVKVSKAQDDVKVTYKCKKTTEADDQAVTKEVTMTPYTGDELTTTLDSLKQYKESELSHNNWVNARTATGLGLSIDSNDQKTNYKITGLAEFAATLDGSLKGYVRKTQNETSVKYVVVKTLDSGGKVIKIAEPITVITTDMSTEITKLAFTGLSDTELKAVTIADGTVLNEEVAEQLGFVLPDAIKNLIEKQPNQANPEYVIKLSKAQNDTKVTYKYKGTTGADAEAVAAQVQVPMISYTEDDLTTTLDNLKQYKTTELPNTDWLKTEAEGFNDPIGGNSQIGYLKIKGLADFAKTLGTGLEVFVRKTKDEGTLKYLVVKTLDTGAKILKTGDPITAITTDIVPEITKLTSTGLDEDELKAVTIAEGTLLTEEVAEQLGFVLSDALKEFIETQPNQANPEYVVEVSKAQDDVKVTYKFRRSTEAADQAITREVIMVPNIDDELATTLDDLRQYKITELSHDDWLKAKTAEGFDVPVDSDEQKVNYKIKDLADFLTNLDESLNAYVRRTQGEETVKYVVVKTLDSGSKIIKISEPTTIISADIAGELNKLVYTGLGNYELKDVTIADGTVLTEEVAEQLGFVLPDTIKKFIETQPNQNNPEYEIKVSKAQDDNKVTYKLKRTGDGDDQAITSEVTMISSFSNTLTKTLNDLKQYDETEKNHNDWLKSYAEDFKIAIGSSEQEQFLKIKNLADYAKTLDQGLEAYIRKTKDEETMKYVVVKTLDSGAKVIRIGEPITVTSTESGLEAIKTKLEALMTDQNNPLTATVNADDFKKEEQARIQILPDGGTPYDWSQIKINTPAADQLPTEDMLQDAVATDKGKIEIEKKVGETTLHWYITYIDSTNTPITDEYEAEVTLKTSSFPTVAEAQAKDWAAATELQYGDAPSKIDGGAFKNKPVLTRITLEDDTVFYLYTNNADGATVQSRRYNGKKLDDKKRYWIASNAKSSYYKEIRILQSESDNPGYKEYKIHPKEVKYMYL